jgi:glutamine amidotransferase/cyclase
MMSNIQPNARQTVSLLDYGAGNVRSVRNAIQRNGWDIADITDPSQIESAKIIIFPGVGSFGNAMQILQQRGYVEPLQRYLRSNRPFLGICLGMQTLFTSSEECSSPSASSTDHITTQTIPGLGFLPGHVTKFDKAHGTVPHIGWNGRIYHQRSPVFQYTKEEESVYFVHSYYVPLTEQIQSWILSTTTYGNVEFVSAIQKGNVVAMQFHPEKSGNAGLNIIKGFLEVGCLRFVLCLRHDII